MFQLPSYRTIIILFSGLSLHLPIFSMHPTDATPHLFGMLPHQAPSLPPLPPLAIYLDRHAQPQQPDFQASQDSNPDPESDTDSITTYPPPSPSSLERETGVDDLAAYFDRLSNNDDEVASSSTAARSSSSRILLKRKSGKIEKPRSTSTRTSDSSVPLSRRTRKMAFSAQHSDASAQGPTATSQHSVATIRRSNSEDGFVPQPLAQEADSPIAHSNSDDGLTLQRLRQELDSPIASIDDGIEDFAASSYPLQVLPPTTAESMQDIEETLIINKEGKKLSENELMSALTLALPSTIASSRSEKSSSNVKRMATRYLYSPRRGHTELNFTGSEVTDRVLKFIELWFPSYKLTYSSKDGIVSYISKDGIVTYLPKNGEVTKSSLPNPEFKDKAGAEENVEVQEDAVDMEE